MNVDDFIEKIKNLSGGTRQLPWTEEMLKEWKHFTNEEQRKIVLETDVWRNSLAPGA